MAFMNTSFLNVPLIKETTLNMDNLADSTEKTHVLMGEVCSYFIVDYPYVCTMSDLILRSNISC